MPPTPCIDAGATHRRQRRLPVYAAPSTVSSSPADPAPTAPAPTNPPVRPRPSPLPSAPLHEPRRRAPPPHVSWPPSARVRSRPSPRRPVAPRPVRAHPIYRGRHVPGRLRSRPPRPPGALTLASNGVGCEPPHQLVAALPVLCPVAAAGAQRRRAGARALQPPLVARLGAPPRASTRSG